MLIEINFIPFEAEVFKIKLFRRKFNQESRAEGFCKCQLKIGSLQSWLISIRLLIKILALGRFDAAK